YALGGTLYHLLTGQVPFAAPSALQIMRAHPQDELENPSDINPDLSLGAVQIVTKLMAKSPDARYQSATEVAEDIDLVLSGQIPRHATLEQHQSSIRPRRIHRRKAAARAGCMSLLVLGLCVAAIVLCALVPR
ncbi:MAG: hypothetical protein NTW87_21085, partial [Planctomycetota bacterium]|nr:hypothetical protein [Planctomycetota bacterium]